MNYSVFLFGFVCLVLTVNAETIEDDFAGVRVKCFEQEGLAEGELSAAGSSTFLDNPKAKCYLKCFITELNLYKEDKSIDIDEALLKISEDIREEATPLVIKCITDNKDVTDQCEQAFGMVKCFYEANPDIFQQLGILEPPKRK